jgi:hypothetical protein
MPNSDLAAEGFERDRNSPQNRVSRKLTNSVEFNTCNDQRPCAFPLIWFGKSVQLRRYSDGWGAAKVFTSRD